MTHRRGAQTVVAGVIGDPIRHSRSPAILNAAFAATGLDWTFVAFEVPEGAGADAARAASVLGLGGLSVTMPHKEAVIGALDIVKPVAGTLGAVNCISREEGLLVGHNTDGAGFLASLADEGVEVKGARCVVLGAGGAARSVILALAGAGAVDVAVVNRGQDRAEKAAELAGAIGRFVAAADVGEPLEQADLLVNATPLGMRDGDPCPVEPSLLHDSLFVSDLIYHPNPTVLMVAADAAGARFAGGLGMLVGQAAEAFRIWTGLDAPVEEMSAAALQ
ncbi:MAG: shikimate dehydrogenase [Microthrixaceae bacterium]